MQTRKICSIRNIQLSGSAQKFLRVESGIHRKQITPWTEGDDALFLMYAKESLICPENILRTDNSQKPKE